MQGEDALIRFAGHSYPRTVTRASGRVFHFLGYGHSNAIAIVGESSVILVDALDSRGRGEALKEELGKLTDKPVKTLIYTHSHPDHRGGAGAFWDTVEEVIAFAPLRPPLKYYERLEHVLERRGSFQHGYGLTDGEAVCQGIGPREGKEMGEGGYDFLPPTTVYCGETVERVIDGVRLSLSAAPGETDDQLCVWLPEDKVLCSGDNYYGCWPNLYAVRGTQYRDAAVWIDTLGRLLDYPAQALLPGHTRPLIGRETVREVLGAFRDALESVLFQTLDCMDRGMTLEETVRTVRLPEELAAREYLGEYYGTVEWSVKSICQGYVGWFDGDPVKLMPVPEAEYRRALLELIGDADRVVEKAEACLRGGNGQLALQLLELLPEEQRSARSNARKREALLLRARQMTSANARHYLLAAAKQL